MAVRFNRNFVIMISLIAAIGKNNEIGANNQLMWKLKDDMKLFMNETMYHVVIMGRKSYESMGGPLRNRRNVVITRNKDFQPEGVMVFNNLDAALDHFDSADEEIFVIGGGDIYEQVMDRANRLYITHVDASFPQAEVFFPEFDPADYQVLREIRQNADERNEYDYTFRLYQKL